MWQVKPPAGSARIFPAETSNHRGYFVCYNECHGGVQLATCGAKNPMADKRIVAYHVSRLQDKSPDIRLKAIRELGLLGDPETFDVLQSVFKTDTDAEVRKAAQDAGRAIFVKQREQSGV